MVHVLEKINISLEDVIIRNSFIEENNLDSRKIMNCLDKNKYFIMTKVGTRIWDLTKRPIRVRAMISTLIHEFDIDTKICEVAVIDFLNKLSEKDLIKIS